MSSRSHERRTDRATAEDVAEIERQLWEFSKRIDPPGVPEAKLRPGAFLWRVHRTWHSLGRGTGGLASRSFRALRDELLRRDPPVRNLQPKLYGNTPLAHAEAEQLIDVMLETWHLERGRNGKWQARPLTHSEDAKPADGQDLEAIRENLLHTLFKGDDQLLLEEPVGVPPEVFLRERGKSSIALITPAKSDATARLSPSNAYGGFSNLMSLFFEAAKERYDVDRTAPLSIWILKLGSIRDNSEFHQAFHNLATYSASLTNWFFRLSRLQGRQRSDAEKYWDMLNRHSVFIIHGLPNSSDQDKLTVNDEQTIDSNLADLDESFFIPENLPIMLRNHAQIRRHKDRNFSLSVSLDLDDENDDNPHMNYWLFPDKPKDDLEITAETTNLPVFNAEMSPGKDFDLAFRSAYEAASYYLKINKNKKAERSYNTLAKMGWKLFDIYSFQHILLTDRKLSNF